MSLLGLYRSLYSIAPEYVRRRAVTRLPLGVGQITVDLPEGGHLIFDRIEESEVFKRLLWQGFEGYESKALRLFHLLAGRSRVVFDIGAYFGYYALVAARANPNVKVHAFEPVRESAALLRHFAELNRIASVAVHEVALGRKSGVGVFYLPDRSLSRIPNIGSLKNRFEPGGSFSDRGYVERSVQMVRLDEFVERMNIGAVDLIKIDTEETEVDILEGAKSLLSSCTPDMIIEIIPHADQTEALESLLRGFGYRFYEIADADLVPFANLREVAERLAGQPLRRRYDEVFCSARPEHDVDRIREALGP